MDAPRVRNLPAGSTEGPDGVSLIVTPTGPKGKEMGGAYRSCHPGFEAATLGMPASSGDSQMGSLEERRAGVPLPGGRRRRCV